MPSGGGVCLATPAISATHSPMQILFGGALSRAKTLVCDSEQRVTNNREPDDPSVEFRRHANLHEKTSFELPQ
jgi:hypothetical protein